MAKVREERRLVTVLFADVVGSTAITERHDPEEARLIVGEAIARSIRIVEAYEGTVKDLAGDGMLALFGAPRAHEDDCERALRAALEIAATVTDYADEVRRGWDVEGFGIRVGVETGEVVVGEIGAGSRVEYGATGDAVNVAARLQALAPPGGVLVGEVSRRLAGDRFTWAEPATLSLKGRSTPVTAATVLAVRDVAPSPRALPPLVGREQEMQALTEALSALAAGRGGIVFLSGEPGIGKSRLTSEARRQAEASGLQWLEGRAVSYGGALAWWPLRDLLRGWIGVGTQEPELRARVALRRHVDELAPERAADLLPYLSAVLGVSRDAAAAATLDQLSAEALQFQTYVVIGEVISALAERQPLVVAIEDLHWADPTTLSALDRLLSLTESAPVMFLFNHRPETSHGSWMLRERAMREFRHLLTVVDVGPLDEMAERALLTSVSEGALAAEWTDRLVAYAEGNPLYLEELARALDEKATAGDDIVVPPTLESVILARIDRLDPDVRQLLTAASTCGRSFSTDLLGAVAGMQDDPELRTRLHQLLRLDLLQEERRWPEPSYRFKHALIQDTAYGTLVGSRRRELHALAARWFEDRYRDNPARVHGLVAHHWLQADNLERAATYLGLAGAQALEEWSLDEAIGHLRNLVQVLRRSGRESEAARPLYQLAFTLHLAMRFGEANQAWEEAGRVSRPSQATVEAPTASLVIGVNQMPWDADLFSPDGTFSANFALTLQLGDPLLAVRPGPCVEPLLAERLEVDPTGRRYCIHLRSGLAFAGGRPFDAHALVESFKVFLRRSGDAAILWAVEGAERLSTQGDDSGLGIVALDDRRVELHLTRAVPQFPMCLTTPSLGALPGEHSGPYRLVELTPERVAIEADPAYRRPRVGNVARAEWRRVDGASVAPLLSSGEIDVAHYVRKAPLGIAGMKEVLGAPAFTIGLTPSWVGPPVDAALRRALALAVDRSLFEGVLHPTEVVAHGGLVPPALPGHTPGIAPGFDPDGAQRSLAESGHRGPLLVGYFAPTTYEAVLVTSGCWRDVLGLEVQTVPIAISEAPTAARRLHVMQSNWIAHEPDPSYFLEHLLHALSPSNWWGVSDPRLDALLDRAAAATNGGERMRLYHEADRIAVAEDHLTIPLVYRRMLIIHQPWVDSWWDWANPNQRISEVRIAPPSPRRLSEGG